MKFFLLFFLLYSCSEEKTSYFPLDKIKSWSYSVEILPEVEKKMLYKKTNISLGKTKIASMKGNQKSFPVLREDGTSLYYQILPNGIFRSGVKYLKDSKISLEKKKRIVLPYPLKLNQEWNVESKTYLILRRYPYYDYRATTDFNLKYKVISFNESVTTPFGKFKDCLFIKGEGQTKFIDNEIGTIDINITSEEWYSRNVGLIKVVRVEKTDTDLFGTTKMVQLLEDYKKK